MSQDNIISRSTDTFNKDKLLVSRHCWAHQSINAINSTTDPLLQSFTIPSTGNLSFTESCPLKNSWISKAWTISPFTKLNLPTTCKITSEKLNCSALSIKSNKTKENTFPDLRMTILEQHWATKEPKQQETQPLPLPPLGQFKHLICAGGTLLVISLTAVGIKLIAAFIRRRCKPNDNISIQPTTSSGPIPSAPYNPEIVRDVLGLNQSMELCLEDRMNQINDAIRLNQLMDFGLTRGTQISLEAFLLETEAMSPEEEVNASQF